jgi:hypothetical protein
MEEIMCEDILRDQDQLKILPNVFFSLRLGRKA